MNTVHDDKWQAENKPSVGCLNHIKKTVAPTWTRIPELRASWTETYPRDLYHQIEATKIAFSDVLEGLS